MVNNEIETLLQNTINSFINSNGVNYKAIYNGYTCKVNHEINYQFRKAIPKNIVVNIAFGSATKNNDLEDKYNMNFVINIQSEINGGDIAKSLFDDIFKKLTRTYQTLGTYNSKIFLTSPVLMQSYVEIEDSFCCLYTMNGSVEFSESVVLGCKYELSVDGTNYVEIKPRQPYALKERIGALDTPLNAPDETTFTKSSSQRTFNLTLVYEKKSNQNFTKLMDALLNECYYCDPIISGNPNGVYKLKVTINNAEKVIDNLYIIRGQHIFDESTGENVLSLQFKKRTATT